MSLTPYSIATLATPAGILELILHHEDPSLVLPAEFCFSGLSPLIERIENKPGALELPTLEVSLMDVPTAEWPDGFWFNALHESLAWSEMNPELQCILTETGSASATHFFWGTLDPASCEWTEHSFLAEPGGRIRTARLTFVGAEKRIMTLSWQSFFDSLAAKEITDDQLTYRPVIGSVARSAYAQNDGITYKYRVAARTMAEEYLWGAEAETTQGPVTLDEFSFLTVAWSGLPGALQYAVYRTADGVSGYGRGLIGVTSSNSFSDLGFLPVELVPSGEPARQTHRSCRSFIPLDALFRLTLALAFAQPDHPAAAQVAGEHIKILSPLGEHGIETLFLLARKNYGTLAAPQMDRSEYLLPSNELCWSRRFRSPFDLLGALCRNFGLALRHSYDLANARQTLALFPRGRSDGQCIAPAGEVTASKILGSYLAPSAVETTGAATPAAVRKVARAEGEKDLSFALEFGVGSALAPVERLFVAEETTLGFRFREATGVKFYDCQLNGWVTETDPLRLHMALARYYWSALARRAAILRRRYDGLAAGNGGTARHTLLAPGARMEERGRTYYANQVSKDIFGNAAEVEWVEE